MKRIVVHGVKESGWFADNPTNPHVAGAQGGASSTGAKWDDSTPASFQAAFPDPDDIYDLQGKTVLERSQQGVPIIDYKPAEGLFGTMGEKVPVYAREKAEVNKYRETARKWRNTEEDTGKKELKVARVDWGPHNKMVYFSEAGKQLPYSMTDVRRVGRSTLNWPDWEPLE
jgi:hypothetical protein